MDLNLTSESCLLEREFILYFSVLNLNRLSDHLSFSNCQNKFKYLTQKQNGLNDVNL